MAICSERRGAISKCGSRVTRSGVLQLFLFDDTEAVSAVILSLSVDELRVPMRCYMLRIPTLPDICFYSAFFAPFVCSGRPRYSAAAVARYLYSLHSLTDGPSCLRGSILL